VGAVCSEIIVLVISGLRVIEWYASFFSRNWPYWSGGRRRLLTHQCRRRLLFTVLSPRPNGRWRKERDNLFRMVHSSLTKDDIVQ